MSGAPEPPDTARMDAADDDAPPPLAPAAAPAPAAERAAAAPTSMQRSRERFLKRVLIVHGLMCRLRQRVTSTIDAPARPHLARTHDVCAN